MTRIKGILHVSVLLIWSCFLLDSTFAFSGTAFGSQNSKGGSGKRKKKGKDKPNSSSSSPQKQSILLGVNKSVDIWVPPNALEDDRGEMKKFTSALAASSSPSTLLEEYASYRGTGDVIWPSSLHLSRLLANCPSFVTGRRVLDLGCGLGLASLATLLGRPTSLTLSDVDPIVLDSALRSCRDHLLRAVTNDDDDDDVPRLARCPLDWSDPATYVSLDGAFDTVVASDVLYDAAAAEHVANLLGHVLLGGNDNDDGPSKQALLVDPVNRVHREAFVQHAHRNGFAAEPVPFPGQEDDFVLINVTPLV